MDHIWDSLMSTNERQSSERQGRSSRTLPLGTTSQSPNGTMSQSPNQEKQTLGPIRGEDADAGISMRPRNCLGDDCKVTGRCFETKGRFDEDKGNISTSDFLKGRRLRTSEYHLRALSPPVLLQVKSGSAAERALQRLRVYIRRLRVNQESEAIAAE